MTHEELEARIELLTRECDDRRRRCAMLARAHGALADAGCIVPTAMDETIEHAIKALAKERDQRTRDLAHAEEAIARLEAERDDAREERDDLRAEITKAQRSFDDDGPSGWMPGETAIDALIRTRNEAQSAWQSERCLRLSAESERDAAELYAKAMIGGAQAMTAHNIAELERAKASLSIYEQSYGPKEQRARAKAFDCAIHIVKHGLGVEDDS